MTGRAACVRCRPISPLTRHVSCVFRPIPRSSAASSRSPRRSAWSSRPSPSPSGAFPWSPEPLPLGLWGYAPASFCVECHQSQTAAWRKQAHAHSVQTLQREGRLLPECLTCHSEYFRMTNQFALLPAGEDGVQCATCHGDGLLHSVSSRKEQVFRKVPEDLCQSCHNQERDPDCVAGYQSACLVFAEAPPEGQMIRGIQTTPRGRRTPPAPRPGRSRQAP